MSAVEDIKAASSELLTAPPAKALLRFALPLMAGGACQQIYALTDVAVVGRVLGVNALSALGAAAASGGGWRSRRWVSAAKASTSAVGVALRAGAGGGRGRGAASLRVADLRGGATWA